MTKYYTGEKPKRMFIKKCPNCNSAKFRQLGPKGRCEKCGYEIDLQYMSKKLNKKDGKNMA